MVVFFSWPFLAIYGILWLVWQSLKALGYSIYFIGWFLVYILIPAVAFVLALVVFGLVKYVFPTLGRKPAREDAVPPVWRGWTPPKDSE